MSGMITLNGISDEIRFIELVQDSVQCGDFCVGDNGPSGCIWARNIVNS
jgi:hypothetical protein